MSRDPKGTSASANPAAARVDDPGALTELLTREGFVAADEEAAELLAAAGGDSARLERLIQRRLTGEPLAWITGVVAFCGITVRVHPGVYVPRWQSEPLARRAADRLPPDGTAIDLCTGAGAIAVVLRESRPGARVLATELNERAGACAAANGVEVYPGDLFSGLPSGLEGGIDVVVGVLPYVPTSAMRLLPRDTLEFESALAYDGGPDGVDVLRRAVEQSRRFLRRGGALLLELGDQQHELLERDLGRSGFVNIEILEDEEGDVRGIEAVYRPG
jgi:release factor glutamine methyltransferase